MNENREIQAVNFEFRKLDISGTAGQLARGKDRGSPILDSQIFFPGIIPNSSVSKGKAFPSFLIENANPRFPFPSAKGNPGKYIILELLEFPEPPIPPPEHDLLLVK